jgi:exodeoxyribonuclease VII large subunit
VSGFKRHRNGHWYFILRDRSGQIDAVVWATDTRRIPAPPDEGMQVCALGRLTVYAARGDLQFAVVRMEAEGDGLRRKAMEITRRRLEADGLLAPERKRQLPLFPRVIAVVTSPDGAALRDITAAIRRRGMPVRMVLVPAAVQGDSARGELCRALERVREWGKADVVIVGRGGGSAEDLAAFNDERVARAVAACPAPTISAVGHETDLTICDLVADVRAATPTAAAELATRSREELLARVAQLGKRMHHTSRGVMHTARARMNAAARALSRGAGFAVERRAARVGAVAGQLHALSPVATMSRGYAVPMSLTGSTLTTVEQFQAGMEYDLVLVDGVVRSTAAEARREAR